MHDEGTVEMVIGSEPVRKRAAPVDTNGSPTIIVHDGDEIGALHGVTQDVTVFGRTPEADVVLAEGQVSRRHAMIRRVRGPEARYELVDLDSTNGTFLNGEMVRCADLKDGDKIVIGNNTLKFAYLDAQDLSYQAKIVEMIHVDELTGLLTKRSFFRALHKELSRAQRYDRPVSVLMMDIDHFKKVNDTHGHLAGSHCLAEVGRHIRESTRQVDVNGRYGGEEFVTYLPETNCDDALMVANRLREGLAAKVMRNGTATFQVTISIGIAQFPENGATFEELIHGADLALYRAKEGGRNKCEMQPSPVGVR